MSDITIYHNPGCGTSRNTLALLRDKGIEPRVVEALANVPSSGKQEPFLSGRDRRELLTHVAVGLGSHPSAQHDKMPRKRSRLLAKYSRWSLRSVSRIGERPSTRAPMTSLRIIAAASAENW